MNALIIEAEKYVTHFLNEKLDSIYLYHNLAHTQRVVEKTGDLAEFCGVDRLEKDRLIISAWFHDTRC